MRTASRSSNSRWTPRTHKTPGKTSASKLSEDLPYGQSGIRRLTGCLRYAPASSQSSYIHNSLRSIKQTAVWRLSSFSPGKFCKLRDFAYGQNLCVLYAKFPPPKAKRLQLVYAPLIPTGEEWTPSLPQCGVDRQHSVAREIPASLAFKAAPRKCKQASIPLGLHLN